MASGNVDGFEQSGVSLEAVIELAGRHIAIRHILYEGGKLTKDGRAFWIASKQTSASLLTLISREWNGSARCCPSILALRARK